jgi:CelD/BcsL family acetyltransferase involved in cellulose biosynthesis
MVDGKAIAYRYAYKFGRRYFAILPARLYGPDWDRYGLGRLTHLMTVEHAITEGVTAIEAGQGHYDYKVRLGGMEYPLHSIMIVANRLGSRLRARAFCAWADTLHLLYYRIWFNRLAPRLPLKRRPLWRCWIRSRV